MSRDLDTRGRKAAENLKWAIAAAELRAIPPGSEKPRRRLAIALRPAVVLTLLAIGSAVAFALVRESTPPATTLAPTPTTTAPPTTTAAPTTLATEPSPPTTAAALPIAPVTTAAPDLEPPLLEITSPEDGAHLEKKTVTFAGVTEPGARVLAGKYEAEVDTEGHWAIVLVLRGGSNVARFVARDGAGNESHASVTVYYVVEQPTTSTTTEKDLAEFSAHATFGSCSEAPPFDVYYGTGQPGSEVHITSEYGSGVAEVGPDGHWEKKVFFGEAPAEQTFLVTVSDDYGRQAQFEFVYAPA